MLPSTTKTKYLIIGNSAGGIGAAEAIREVDRQGRLVIVSDEPYPAYSRPLIAEYLAERRPLERMLFRPPDFYKRHNIVAFLGRKVTRLYPDRQVVELDSGERIRWQKLLLATGGTPIVPPIEGADKKGVFTFTTFDDVKAINRYLDRKARAVVIGGGLIGLSVTEALSRRGMEVTVVEMKERILNVILDETASALEEEMLRQVGIKLMTGHTVAKISRGSRDKITGVILDDGTPIPGELVIVAIGVQPRMELITNTGIEINRGVVVDQYMATSNSDIYACGDVAEAYDIAYGECRLTPIWPNAYIGGRIAGFNMTGTPIEYPGGTAMNSLKYFGLDMVSAGMVTPLNDRYEVISHRTDNTYGKVILKDGLVVGLVFAGNIEKSGIIFNLIKNKIKVEGFKQALVAEDFGLATLPKELWQPYLAVPSSALVSSAETKPVEELATGE
ncbi:MAG: FAD-dependent oxidoreductase [Dehalococcoidales bacterium]|jgi:NAD(P)H-nitrite reductase large subunit|nr:FAD-dependent oxidoreductase [Dehalococcoidales bacterium]MDP7415478.1 FAD-dependent oxidoreductase [Dehalococcoidales bacterium]